MIDILDKDLEENILEIIKRYKLEKYKTSNTDKYYDHTTFLVNSLSDYIHIIGKLALLVKNSPLDTILYRGMSNSEWRLIPSLLRLPAYKYDLEHNLALDFISEEPKLFENSNSNFENLTKMQHFGIPTRLLDFSKNPLIALFFACSENFAKSGRIVFTLNRLRYFNDPLIENISSFHLYDSIFNMPLDKFLRNISIEDYLDSLYLGESSLVFVKPVYLDKRMEVQQSVFLLFHNYIRDIVADNIYQDCDEYKQKYKSSITKKDIKEIYKSQIEQPIIRFGADPAFVVQNSNYKRIIEQNLKGLCENDNFFSSRFLLIDFIEKIDMNDVWFNFSSIIIPGKKKKGILFELQNIGIDESYVYPETSNIANRIKKRYI